ncbi:MAG: ribosome silencing factor [Legionellales bacterium RIFCSPHIGHO2_12_FULL_42_9]|nr:MAG: ribosome silencing factor [Legionellales bacterium RIFCSPHIGHO2_12_FULL_42_9]
MPNPIESKQIDPKPIEPKFPKYIEQLVDVLNEIQASDITVIDVSKQTSVTDYMIICSGRSSRHVKAIGETVLEKNKQRGQPPLGSHGLETGDWVLIDLGDCILHIMQHEVRAHYNLEGLWHN